MDNEIVRVFEIFGNRFEITEEFDSYNIVRSQQAREVGAVGAHYSEVGELMNQDLLRLTEQALKKFNAVVNQINTVLEVASIGFTELQRCQSEVLPRIGKRMIFKYLNRELITVAEVATHIQLDSEKHFTVFLNEVQKVEDKQKSDWISSEYARITRNTSLAGGIGDGMSAAAGILAVNVGTSILNGIGDMISKAMDEADVAKGLKNTVAIGRKALYETFYDMTKQLHSYCINIVRNEMNEEFNKIVRKPFREVTEKQRTDVKAKSENYYKAYHQKDITVERYVSYLMSVVREFPHTPSLYFELYEIALSVNSICDQEAILELTRYLGLETQMTRWMKLEGIQASKKSENEDSAKDNSFTDEYR